MTSETLLQQDSSSIREKLAHNFIPNDACPMGAQLFMESPGEVYYFGSYEVTTLFCLILLYISFALLFCIPEHNIMNVQVEPPHTPDNDIVPVTFETQPDSDTQLAQGKSLLGVDKLLDGVSYFIDIYS